MSHFEPINVVATMYVVTAIIVVTTTNVVLSAHLNVQSMYVVATVYLSQE